MSMKNYETALRGTKKEAEAVRHEIREKMVEYGRKDISFQMTLAHNVLRQICQAMRTNSEHYEIYCDIFSSVLAPNVNPVVNTKHWTLFLEMIRYYYYQLSERERYSDMDKVYEFLKNKPDKLQSERDYEFILGTYAQHLMAQKNLINLQKSSKDKATDVCTQLAKLFTEMLQRHNKLNFAYKDLIKTVTRFLIPKRSQCIYKFIASSSNGTEMLNALLELLAEYKYSPTSVEEIKLLYMDYMDTFLQFFYIKVEAACAQIGLRFLRIYKEITIFKSDKAMSYTLSLLYYFVKLVFTQNVHHFVPSYIELCGKFKEFFDRLGDTLKSENWFTEFVVAMTVLLFELDFSNSVAFRADHTIQATEVANSHVVLIYEFMKLAPRITQSKVLSWPCCKSTRKHITIMLLRANLRLYTFLIDAGGDQKESENVDEVLFHKTFITIMRHCASVINSMVCMDSTSTDLQGIYSEINKVLSKIKSNSQLKLGMTIIEILMTIQDKFTTQMWFQLIYRLRRASPVAMDCKLTAEFHAVQVGFVIKTNKSDYIALLHQVGVYYTSEHLASWDKCLLEILETSKNSLMPKLEAHEKHLLHTIEAQIIFKHQKTNMLLHSSLLKCSQTDLGFILVARENKQALDVSCKVQQILKTLQTKKKGLAGLNRIEKLTLAHTYTLIISQQIEKVKKLFDYPSKDFAEDSLDSILLKEKIKRIDAISEINVINMCSEALRLFEEFYKMADLEPIGLDACLLDWDAILTDIAFLARLVQLRGYLEYACKGWLLIYVISYWLSDNNNTLRSLAFLCEHVEYFEGQLNIDVADEINKNIPVMLNTLHIIQTLVPRRQNYLLLCLCQLGYYYARLGNFNYSQIVLKLVEIKHEELPERKEKFDLVQATLQAVKFRIIWKFIDETEPANTDSLCILRQIETTFNKFRGFVQITSEDSWNYMILLFDLMKDFGECSINRLCDNISNSYYITVLMAALNIGASLRIVQCLTSWALANLQTECVNKAMVKLKIIECFLGLKKEQQLFRLKSTVEAGAAKAPCQIVNCGNGISPLLSINSGTETIRRVAQVQLSPLMQYKLQHTLAADNRKLLCFLKYDTSEVLRENNLLQWTYLKIGHINARLFFLIEDFEQLEDFYQKSAKWCENQGNNFSSLTFQNVQLLSMKHYLVYLRTQNRHDEVMNYVELALHFSIRATRNVDKIYKISLELQKRSTQSQILLKKTPEPKLRNGIKKLRRALEFRLSPEEKEEHQRKEDKECKENSDKGLHNIVKSIKLIQENGSLCPSTDFDTDTSSESELNIAILGDKEVTQIDSNNNNDLLSVEIVAPCFENSFRTSKSLRQKSITSGIKKCSSDSSTPDHSSEGIKSSLGSNSEARQQKQQSRTRRGLIPNLDKRNSPVEVIDNKENVPMDVETKNVLKKTGSNTFNNDNIDGRGCAKGKGNARRSNEKKQRQNVQSKTEVISKMSALNLLPNPPSLTPKNIFKSSENSPKIILSRRRRNQNSACDNIVCKNSSGESRIGEAVAAITIANTRGRKKKTDVEKMLDTKLPNTLETKRPTRRRQQT